MKLPLVALLMLSACAQYTPVVLGPVPPIELAADVNVIVEALAMEGYWIAMADRSGKVVNTGWRGGVIGSDPGLGEVDWMLLMRDKVQVAITPRGLIVQQSVDCRAPGGGPWAVCHDSHETKGQVKTAIEERRAALVDSLREAFEHGRVTE